MKINSIINNDLKPAKSILKSAKLPDNFKYENELNKAINNIENNVIEQLRDTRSNLRKTFDTFASTEKTNKELVNQLAQTNKIDATGKMPATTKTTKTAKTAKTTMKTKTTKQNKPAKKQETVKTKLTGQILKTKVPRITVASGAKSTPYFKNIYLPDKYVATSTKVEPMHYIVELKEVMTVTTTDGTKIKLAKGTKLVAVRGNAYKSHIHSSSQSVTLVIQNGANAGKTFKTNNSKINYLQQLTNSSIQYTKETAENYINTCNGGKPATSGDNTLLWVNHYTQRMYYFTRKNKNSKWVLTYFPVKGYNKTYSVKIGTGSFANSIGVDTENSKNGHQLYQKDSGFQNIQYYIHKDANGSNGIHKNFTSNDSDVGRPVSKGCVRVPTKVAAWIYNNLPASSVSINKGGKATRVVDW